MNRKVLVGATLIGAGLVSSVALAGADSDYPVQFWGTTIRIATGSVWDTRMEASPSSHIGCKLVGYQSFGYVSCTARDAAGENTTCITYHDDPGFEHLARAAALSNAHSLVSFSKESDSIRCRHVTVNNNSRYVQ